MFSSTLVVLLCSVASITIDLATVAAFDLAAFVPPGPLYNSSDEVELLNATNLKPTILGSDRAWMVEFYSSWCGHCQNFAPTFKELAKEVHAWRNVISVGAIDCAQEVNLPACRDFEIMGYPTLMLIPPKARIEDLPNFQNCEKKDVRGMKEEMINFIVKIQSDSSYTDVVKSWPILAPFISSDMRQMWPASETASKHFLVVYEKEDSLLGQEVLLSLNDMTERIYGRRIVRGTAHPNVLHRLGLVKVDLDDPQFFIVESNSLEVEKMSIRANMTVADYVSTLKNYLSSKATKSTVVKPANETSQILHQRNQDSKNDMTHNPEMVHSEHDIKRRRYSVFHADLEKTIVYSLSHEVAQHQMITGEALNALQDYVDLLCKFFPGRSKTMLFLREVREWVLGHDDVVLGEDLSNTISGMNSAKHFQSDLPTNWLACAGSDPKYGGYPCGLWTLWHTMTVSYAKREEGKASMEANLVLKVMLKFIKNFFGCRECARHFGLAAEQGKAFDLISTRNESVLWLWKTHNRVNQRLSGDITDDPAFPKFVFPDRQHCTECRDNTITGSDLWTEFRRKHVLAFLYGLYGEEHILFDHLPRDGGYRKDLVDTHDLVAIPPARKRLVHGRQRKVEERDDATNELKRAGDERLILLLKNNTSSWMAFFTPTDVSICLTVYLLSAVILFLVYLKFVARKKFSSCISTICPRSRSSSVYTSSSRHALLGQV